MDQRDDSCCIEIGIVICQFPTITYNPDRDIAFCLPRYDFPLSGAVWVTSVGCVLIFMRSALTDSLNPVFI